MFLREERCDFNQLNNENKGPFYLACAFGYIGIVQLLLTDQRIKLHEIAQDGLYPFTAACEFKHFDLAKILLRDSFFMSKKPHVVKPRLLLGVCKYGVLDLLEILLADKDFIYNFNKAVPDQRADGTVAGVVPKEIAREKSFTTLLSLMERYQTNYRKVQDELCLKWYGENQPAYTFALTVLLSDDFLKIKETTSSQKGLDQTKQFFKIARELPIELQMVLCHRTIGSPKEIIVSGHTELAFRLIARQFKEIRFQ